MTSETPRLSEAELAEIRRRRPDARASLACEGIHLTAEDEALFEQMDEERLTAEQRIERIIALSRAERSARPAAAE